jgi:hypothetical protein
VRIIVALKKGHEYQWLEKERWDDDEMPETDAALIKRKLEKLMKLEN